MADEIVLDWEMASEWPLLASAPMKIECLSASISARNPNLRKARAARVGAALAEAVGSRMADPELWLLLATSRAVPVASGSAVYRMRKSGLQTELAAAGFGAVDAQFEIVDGTRGRLRIGAMKRLGFHQWGAAISLMQYLPAVGVVCDAADEQALTDLARRLFVGEGAALSSARRHHLQGLFVEGAGSCTGVLTACGWFDDPELTAEYLRPLSDGAEPMFSSIPDAKVPL